MLNKIYFVGTSMLAVALCFWNLWILSNKDDNSLMQVLAAKISPAILIGVTGWLVTWAVIR